MQASALDLQTLANLAEVIGVIIVIGGFAFAVIQLLHFRQQRRATSAIELARSFQNPEFARAIRIVLSLPSGMTGAELRRRGSRHEDAAMLVSLTLESVGIMVHRRIVSIDMVWELMGGLVLDVWDRIRGWVTEVREERGSGKFDEWIEWLATQLSAYGREQGSGPAYEAYPAWRP